MRDVNYIQRGELQARLVQGLALREVSPAPVLASEVVPVVILEDLTSARATRRAVGYEEITSGVAQFAGIELRNLSTTGINLVVDEIHLGAGIASDVDYRVTSAAALVNAPTKASNYRDDIPGQPVGLVKSESLVAFTVGAARVKLLAGETKIISPAWTVVPGNGLRLIVNQTNTAFVATFYYREVTPASGVP